jgi:hypothetical protein
MIACLFCLAVVYPYSLQPGGFDPGWQLANDGFRVWHAKTLTADMEAYVDFRQGENVRWTQAKVTIHKGEEVWSDGQGNLKRGRCGNDISTVAPPKAFVAPAEVDLATPQIAFAVPPELLMPPVSKLDLVEYSMALSEAPADAADAPPDPNQPPQPKMDIPIIPITVFAGMIPIDVLIASHGSSPPTSPPPVAQTPEIATGWMTALVFVLMIFGAAVHFRTHRNRSAEL